MIPGRFAVLGMGRSGIAVSKSAAKRGSKVALFDEKLIESPGAIRQMEELQSLGVEVIPGWHGRLDASHYDVLVTSPGFARHHPALADAQSQRLDIWSEVEYAERIRVAPMLAITGTNGKSTTVAMAFCMVNACAAAHLCGNISGSGFNELTLTEAAELAMEDEFLVAEISSYQLEWVETFAPEVAAITNVTPDHFDRHPNFEDYRNTKLRIFAAQEPGDAVVWNPREPSLPLELISSSIGGGVELIEVHECDFEGTNLTGYGRLEAAELKVVGLHNLLNAATAYQCALALLGEAADPGKMVAALKEFKGIEHRLEPVTEIRGIKIINNSMCTNPAAWISSTKSLEQRQHILMGGNTKHLDFGEVAAYIQDSNHKIYLFGPDAPQSLRHQHPEFGPGFESMEAAFSSALSSAHAGEVVVLSPGCASLPPYANFRERGEAFRKMAMDGRDGIQ